MGERRWGLTGLTVGLVAAVLAAGCSALPGGGLPQAAPARPALGGGDGGCCGVIVRGPQPNWGPDDIVLGFLLASAKPAHDFALARKYLAPGATRNSWRPGSAVTILAQAPQVSTQPRLTPGAANVQVTGQEMATLKGSQYTPAASGDEAAAVESFGLIRVNGRTLIGNLPSDNGLLLTDNLFHLVYTARDLYYYGLRNSGLVPSPVFVPADSDQAVTLVRDLLHNPPGDLRNALTTSFQPGVRLGAVEGAPGKTAIVNLHVPAGTSQRAYQSMARQLVATLTSAGYGPRLFEAVELRINGAVWSPPGGGPVLTLATAGLDVPHPAGNGSVYYVDSTGNVRALSRLAPSGVPVSGDAGSGRVPLGSVAVSPDRKYLAAIGKPADTVYSAGLKPAPQADDPTSAEPLRPHLNGADFTSLSWDNGDNLWAVGRYGHTAGVWVLRHGRGRPVRVSGLGRLGHVTSVRVAPDGIRAAILVGPRAKAHMEIGYIMSKGKGLAITHPRPLGPGLFDVTAMAWFDGDHLVAAARPAVSGTLQGSAGAPQLWEVPVDGDSATTLHWPQAGVTSITAAGQGVPLYLTANGRLLKSVALGEQWTFVTAGQAADYPG